MTEPSLWESVIATAHNNLIRFFITTVLLDILLGTSCAVKTKKINSSTGLNGLARHVSMIAIVIVVDVFLPVFGYPLQSNVVVGFFIIQYWVSITENAGILGVPMPDIFRETLINLRNKQESKFTKNFFIEGQKVNLEVKEENSCEEGGNEDDSKSSTD